MLLLLTFIITTPGSNRVGIKNNDLVLTSKLNNFISYNGVYLVGSYVSTTTPTLSATAMKHTMNTKVYELSNHLGNVLVTVSDARQTLYTGTTVTGFAAIVKSANDYSAFGAPMVGRQYQSANYRYGFNGKENDPEANSTGSGTQDYGMRIYNPSLGRFLSLDPLQAIYPMLTPYQFASNQPIWAIDLDGLESKIVIQEKQADGTLLTISTTNYITKVNVYGSPLAVKGGTPTSTQTIDNSGPLGHGTYTVVKNTDGTFSETWLPDAGNSVQTFSADNISGARWMIQGGSYNGIEQRLNARFAEQMVENGLIGLGYGNEDVRKDVTVLETDNIALKGKFAAFTSDAVAKKYVQNWSNTDPSAPHYSTDKSKQSSEVANSDVLIKWYDGAVSATDSYPGHIGLDREGAFDHRVEGAMCVLTGDCNLTLDNGKLLKDTLEKK